MFSTHQKHSAFHKVTNDDHLKPLRISSNHIHSRMNIKLMMLRQKKPKQKQRAHIIVSNFNSNFAFKTPFKLNLNTFRKFQMDQTAVSSLKQQCQKWHSWAEGSQLACASLSHLGFNGLCSNKSSGFHYS